jgi:hypothetical protein
MSEQEKLMMLMTFWCIWHVRNEVVHDKKAPPIEASRRFLCSYVDYLLAIKQNPLADPAKGKVVVTYETMCPCERRRRMMGKTDQGEPAQWSKPPQGWTRLNVNREAPA